MALPIVMILGIIVVVAAVVVGGALLLTGQNSTNGGSGAQSTINSPSNTTNNTTNSTSNNFGCSTGNGASGSSGQIILSKSQDAALFGSGGTYNDSLSDVTSSQSSFEFLREYAAGQTSPSSSLLNYITDIWVVSYNHSSDTQPFGTEWVFKVSDGGMAFFKAIQKNTTIGNANLSTAAGLTYYYSGTPGGAGDIVGYKGSYYVIFSSDYSKATNVTMACMMGEDLSS